MLARPLVPAASAPHGVPSPAGSPRASHCHSQSGVPSTCPRRLEAPFQESADATAYIGRLEATGGEVSQWLAGQGPAVLSCIVPLPPDASDGGGGAAAGSAAAAAGRQEAAAGSETTALGAPAGQAAAAAAAAAAAVAGLHIGSGGSRGHASQRADKDLQDELAAEARWVVGCRLLGAAACLPATGEFAALPLFGPQQTPEHESVCHGALP